MPASEDNALLLRRFPYGESSLVVHALTRAHGRVALLARGAYRPKSAYCGVLDLFDTLRIGWSASPRSELGSLRAASIEARRRGITRSLARYRAALAVLELADLGSRAGQPEPGLFELCEGSLERLDAGRVDPDLELVAFDLRFLHNLGLAPALEACAACGGPAPPLASGGSEAARAAFSAAI